MADEVEVGDVFQQVYNCLERRRRFLFLMCTQLTRQIPSLLVILTHENADEFAMVWDTYADEAPY